MIDVLSLAEQDTNLKKESVNSRCGPCPNLANGKCDRRNDGFVVKWDAGRGTWIFSCRGCWNAQDYLPDKDRKRGWGDAIDYLRHFRGMSFQEAKSLVEDGQEQGVPASQKRHTPEQVDYRSDQWQALIGKTTLEYVARLWSEDGRIALDYAHSRGLHDDIIRDALIGYSTKGDIPRLCIPVQNDGRYFAVYRRDLRPDTLHDQRWRDAPGGTKNELYMADSLKRKGYPVILVESAIDALSIWQECKDLVNVVATGSADCGRLIKWIARLARVPLVLVAFDADEAGDKNAKWWIDRLQNAKRLRPFLHDVNDMLVQGWDIRQWVIDALPAQDEHDLCVMCGRSIQACADDDSIEFSFDELGKAHCSICTSAAQSTTENTPDNETADSAVSLSPDKTDSESSPHDNPVLKFAAHLLNATVHIDAPGYSIRDRVKEIEQELAQRDLETREHLQQIRRQQGKVGAA